MTTDHAIRAQRAWARIAGLMYWVVLVADLTGVALHSPLGRALALTGALATVPLALGLFFAVRPVQPGWAAAALGCRLLEAALATLSTAAGFAIVRAHLAGTPLLRLAEWDDRTAFAAFSFTVGSTIFFALFVSSRLIPRLLAGWGLFASVIALLACFTHLLRPTFPAMTMFAWIPMLLAEISTGLWLLLRSVAVATSGSTTPTPRAPTAVATP